jgi:hypothetical protein
MRQERQETWECRRQIREGLAKLANRKLIYDTGKRRKGQIVRAVTPGKEAEVRALQEEAFQDDHGGSGS